MIFPHSALTADTQFKNNFVVDGHGQRPAHPNIRVRRDTANICHLIGTYHDSARGCGFVQRPAFQSIEYRISNIETKSPSVV